MLSISKAFTEKAKRLKKKKLKKRITQGLTVSCTKKNYLHQIYLHNHTVASELKFKHYRNTLTRL